MIALFLLAAADVDATEASQPDSIIVTASRLPEKQSDTAASVNVIDQTAISRQGDPFIYEFLREIPSAAVSSSGPAGEETQIRIRGAAANHTLLFIDGIEANDLSGSDQPRFELLNADIASRIEVVRGPQSALWGAQAIGGVIAVTGSPADKSSYSGEAEGGSFGLLRANTAATLVSGNMQLDGALGWQRATGVPQSGPGGNNDGYHNLSGRVLASWTIAPGVKFGVNGFSLNGFSQYAGTDPFTFAPTENLSSRFGIAAGRIWSTFGSTDEGFGGSASASLFEAHNHFLFAGQETNRTRGVRGTISGQLHYGFDTGSLKQQLIAAGEYQNEAFKSRDTVYGGLSDANKRRVHEAVTGEWKADAGAVVGDIALRHDFFSKFRDATTLRASLLARLGQGFSLAVSYGEGIAPPTFTEMYGFFPGTFIGNSKLKPESSRGLELSLRYRRGPFDAAVTGYRQKLHDEIVSNADFTSSLNAPGTSHRTGLELEMGLRLAQDLRVSANYSYLHATKPNATGQQVEEIRRPQHSGSIAVDGSTDRLSYGGSLAYVGVHTDTNFDVFPAEDVRLGSYWLANARIAYAIRPGFEIFVRGSNLFGQDYQDVRGYHTEGRGLYAGIRLSSPH